MVKTISILGCGWFGLPFAKELIKVGFSVNGSTTTVDKLAELKSANINPYLIDTEEGFYADDFFKCDVLLINIPPKKKIVDIGLYPIQIQQIADKATENGIKQIMLISSTGIFEDGNFAVDEDTLPQPNTPAGDKLKLAENVLSANKNFTTTIIRFAGLIGPNRNLAKFFAGRTEIPNGLAPINLIHLVDCIGLCQLIIAKQAFGRVYHAVGPQHPTRKEFYAQTCKVLGMPVPKFLNEKKNWKQVESKNVPEVLAYKYVYANWDKYFKELTDD